MSGPIFHWLEGIITGNAALVTTYTALILVIFLFSFPLHELAHALAADRLGDDTARRNGRISLNPFVHLSLLGCALFLFTGFGWASTPINPRNFSGNWRAKHALVAVAGPLTNLALAVAFSLVNRAGVWLTEVDPSALTDALLAACRIAVLINVGLFLLNLLPIPPLDGGTILKAFASEGVQDFMDRIGIMGTVIFLMLSQTGVISLMIGEPMLRMTRWLIQLGA